MDACPGRQPQEETSSGKLRRLILVALIPWPLEETTLATTIVVNRTHTAASYEYQALQVDAEIEVPVHREPGHQLRTSNSSCSSKRQTA